MDEKTIEAILAALKDGFRVELLLQKDGTVIAQTIQRKKLKIKPTAKMIAGKS